MILNVLLSLSILVAPRPVGFNYAVWEDAMEGYGDAAYIWRGINDGFDIGWLDGMEPDFGQDPTLPTTESDDFEITQWIVKRHASGILLGPFTEESCPFPQLYFAPLFTVAKPLFKRRVVGHLSWPRKGVSVNDCIDPAAKAVSYILFTELAKFIYDLGPGAFLWVVDAKDAYYRVPIKSKFWKYMAIKWFGVIFVFTSLQMGLGSACAIYQRFADAILYIIRTKTAALFVAGGTGQPFIHHYLDDFFGGHSDKHTAKLQLMAVWLWFYVWIFPHSQRN